MAATTVRLTLMADLRKYLPKGVLGAQTYTLAPGATAGDLITLVGIVEDEVTVSVNGELGKRTTTLADGDDIVLFSPMEGG